MLHPCHFLSSHQNKLPLFLKSLDVGDAALGYEYSARRSQTDHATVASRASAYRNRPLVPSHDLTFCTAPSPLHRTDFHFANIPPPPPQLHLPPSSPSALQADDVAAAEARCVAPLDRAGPVRTHAAPRRAGSVVRRGECPRASRRVCPVVVSSVCRIFRCRRSRSRVVEWCPVAGAGARGRGRACRRRVVSGLRFVVVVRSCGLSCRLYACRVPAPAPCGGPSVRAAVFREARWAVVGVWSGWDDCHGSHCAEGY